MKLLPFVMFALAMTFASAGAQGGQTDALYEIPISVTPLALSQGQRGEVQIKLKMKEGAHISPDAPLKVALHATNLKLEKAKLNRSDAEHQADGPLFVVPVTGESAGTATLEADLVFFVCTEKLCERQAKKVSIAVTVI